MTDNERHLLLTRWVEDALQTGPIQLVPASCDASFRRYWRAGVANRTFIAMDAPPEREDNARFVRIAMGWRAAGLNVPEILAMDLEHGFLLITDLGHESYLDVLDADNANRLYADALTALLAIQTRAPMTGLPPYDEALLRRELDLFDEWLLKRFLALPASRIDTPGLKAARTLLVANALEQPRVCVHRDYHSRNLMASTPRPGILDFQDAVIGPVTYDLVSLLRDCYIAWPQERVATWARSYFERAAQAGVLGAGHGDRWQRWMDLMGIQRHLKAAGIFARLKLRDARPGYLGDIPRTLHYVLEVATAYAELAPLVELIGKHVLPACQRQIGVEFLFPQYTDDNREKTHSARAKQ